MPHLASNIKRVQANQLSSIPPLKPLENLSFSDNSREQRSQINHSNSSMGGSNLTHQGRTITLVLSSKRKNCIRMKTRSTAFLAIAITITLLDAAKKIAYCDRKT